MKTIKIVILGMLFFGINAYAQETYTLEKCLEMAFANNFNLKRTQLRGETSKVNLNQSWGNIMPSINGNYNIGINNGRSIDPFTNDYINQKLTFSNAGLSVGLTIFNGFRLKNTIKQSYLNLRASEMEIEEDKQNLTVRVTLAYLQVLNTQDLVALNIARQEVTKKQVDRLQVLFNEGEGSPANYTDMKGQLANDEVSIIASKNNLKVALTDLFQLIGLELEYDATFEDVDPLRVFELYPMTGSDIYNEALQNLATFKAKELRQDAAESAVSVAKGGFSPQISLFGGFNTNYSSAARLFKEIGTNTVQTGNFVNINGQQYDVFANQTQYETSEIDYWDQFDNNLSSSYGLSVSIPLFNGFRTNNNIKLRKIQLEESELELKDTKFQFKQSIELAYTNMEAAYNRFEALMKQVDAFQESFRVNEIRFNNGVSNVVEYIISKNNLDVANQNLSMARYEFILRTKILDYYRGNL